MPSAWITTRATKDGKRYRVMFRLGGRESMPRYGGSFKTRRMRRPAATGSRASSSRSAFPRSGSSRRARPLSALREMADRWRSSRVDVTESTRVLHRVALDRVLPILGDRHVDQLDVADFVDLVTRLHEAG